MQAAWAAGVLYFVSLQQKIYIDDIEYIADKLCVCVCVDWLTDQAETYI